MPKRFSDIHWDDLKFFLEAARNGTVRGAAAALRTNHATVSRRLTSLEASLGARLFDRSRDGLKLTQLGEDLQPFAVNIAEEISAASRAIAGHDEKPTGLICISVPPFMFHTSIGDDLAAFAAEYTNIDLHFDVSNSFADLHRREADISIRYAHSVTDNAVGRVLANCTRAAYCSPKYAEGMLDNQGNGLNWIGWNEPEAETTADWTQKTDYPKATLLYRVNDAIPQMVFAKAGAGLAFVPCFVGDWQEGLVRAPFQNPIQDRKLWVLMHRDMRKAARVRLFVDFLVGRIEPRRSEFESMDA